MQQCGSAVRIHVLIAYLGQTSDQPLTGHRRPLYPQTQSPCPATLAMIPTKGKKGKLPGLSKEGARLLTYKHHMYYISNHIVICKSAAQVCPRDGEFSINQL